MLAFLLRAYNYITGEISNIVHWITDTIAAVYSYIESLWHILSNDLADLWNQLQGWAHAIWGFIEQVYNFARAIVDVVIRDLISWVRTALTDLLNFIKGVYGALVVAIDFLKRMILATANAIVQWVIHNVYDPLANIIAWLYHWVTTDGYLVYYYITHPDKLVALLAHWLWLSWIDLLKTYGKAIGHWLVHQMLGLAGPLFDVLETILSGIL